MRVLAEGAPGSACAGRMTREAVRNLASAAFVMTHVGLLGTDDYDEALMRCNAWLAMVGHFWPNPGGPQFASD